MAAQKFDTTTNKVTASAAGAGLGAAMLGLTLWLIGVLGYGQAGDADSVTAAVAAVPSAIALPLSLVLPPAVAYLLGYLKVETVFPTEGSLSAPVSDADPVTLTVTPALPAEPSTPAPEGVVRVSGS